MRQRNNLVVVRREARSVLTFIHEARIGRRYPRTGGFRLQVGQRYHRLELPNLVWRVVRVYRDAQGLEHATLNCAARDLDNKTLSAAVLLDRYQYRMV